jgi:hypothetical protein
MARRKRSGAEPARRLLLEYNGKYYNLPAPFRLPLPIRRTSEQGGIEQDDLRGLCSYMPSPLDGELHRLAFHRVHCGRNGPVCRVEVFLRGLITPSYWRDWEYRADPAPVVANAAPNINARDGFDLELSSVVIMPIGLTARAELKFGYWYGPMRIENDPFGNPYEACERRRDVSEARYYGLHLTKVRGEEQRLEAAVKWIRANLYHPSKGGRPTRVTRPNPKMLQRAREYKDRVDWGLAKEVAAQLSGHAVETMEAYVKLL